MSGPRSKIPFAWKLTLALAFLLFSLWLSVGPLLLGMLDSEASHRGPLMAGDLKYGGYESPSDLLRIHSSFKGDPRDIEDPFVWMETEPDPGPGGVATVLPGPETIKPGENIVTEPGSGEPEEVEIPQIRVKLILRTRQTSRALVDGQVLGVGDLTRAGKIVQILDTGVETLYRGKKLFFALSPR